MACATMRAAHAQTVVERSAVGLNDLLALHNVDNGFY